MSNIRPYVIWGLAVTVCLSGCDPSPERRHDADSSPSASIDFDGWTERITNRSWQERKLAQRQLMLETDPDLKAGITAALIEEAGSEPDPQRLHRLVGTALRTDGDAAALAVSRMLQDDDTALDKKLSVAGAIARHPSADLIADDLATLARAMVTSETDPLHFEFGVRVLNRVSTDDVLPHIERGLTHEDLRFRRAAAASLKDGALPRALPLVVELTAHPETRVRKRAVQALEHYLDTPRGRAALLDNLDNETDSEVCTRAIETLAFDGPSAAAALVERLDPDTPGCGPEHGFVVLASVRRALREHPLTPQVDDALREVAANHPDPGMRGYAAAALGDLELAKSLGGVASYDGLSLMTSRSLESLDTRLGAIAALGELDVTGSAERLEGLLGNIDAEPEQLMAVMDVLENTGKADPAKTFLAFPYTSSLEEPALRQRALAFMKRTSSFPARAEPEGHDEKVHDH